VSTATRADWALRRRFHSHIWLTTSSRWARGDGLKEVKSVATRERLIKEHSEVPLYRGHLAYTLRQLGQVERALGDANAEVARTTRAVGLLEAMNKVDELRSERVCGHAALAGLAKLPGSGLSVAAGAAEVDRAMLLVGRWSKIGPPRLRGTARTLHSTRSVSGPTSSSC
jgi:prophage DNA circulation protein